MTAARTSGIAPLYVFFDATTTTSNRTTLPFHEIQNDWNFGESSGPGVVAWSTGARAGVSSRNTATGPIAAHVFETPGTYTASVTASDGMSTDTRTVTITVIDPNRASQFAGAKTVCLSNNTDFTGCPSGAKQVSSSTNLSQLVTEVNAGGRRILFHRAHAWTVSATQTVYVTAAADPGLIGAFGTGADPVWRAASGFASGTPMLNLSSVYAKSMEDWRIMDIKLDGTSVAAPKNLWGINLNGGLDQATFLRITADAITIPIAGSISLLDAWNGNANPAVRGHHIWDELAIIDLKQLHAPHGVQGTTGTYPYGLFIAGERMAIMGGDFDNLGDNVIGVSHNIRIQYAGKFIVANNNIAHPGSTQHNLKIHSSNWLANPANPNDPNAYTPPLGVTGLGNASIGVPASLGAGYTRWGYIADNNITGSYNPYLVSIGPHSDSVQNRLRDIIVERNWMKHGIGGQRSMSLEGTYITARNNLLDLSAAAIRYGIYVGKRAPTLNYETVADHVSIHNNSIYAGASGSGFRGIWIEAASGSTNITAKNNLAYAPNDPKGALIFGQAANVTGGNSSEISSISANPQFSGPLTSTAGWDLSASSYAKSAGVSAPVWRDFFEVPRPRSATMAIGAAQ